MTKRFSPVAVGAFQEALTKIYWYKNDLKAFLVTALGGTGLVNEVNWEQHKRQIVADLVRIMTANAAKHGDSLMFLMVEVSKIDDFEHLARLDDGAIKVAEAKRTVAALREMVNNQGAVNLSETQLARRRLVQIEEQEIKNSLNEELRRLRDRYAEIATKLAPQNRGFRLEKFMYDLFALFDLDPKASFRITGEQIDGAFTFDSTDYLFEAKWTGMVSVSDLDAFASKANRRLDNTLGLMLSINGFQPTGLQAHQHNRAVLILMTGADLMAVLEGRISLPDMLLRKRRHASQTGSILLEFADM